MVERMDPTCWLASPSLPHITPSCQVTDSSFSSTLTVNLTLDDKSREMGINKLSSVALSLLLLAISYPYMPQVYVRLLSNAGRVHVSSHLELLTPGKALSFRSSLSPLDRERALGSSHFAMAPPT